MNILITSQNWFGAPTAPTNVVFCCSLRQKNDVMPSWQVELLFEIISLKRNIQVWSSVIRPDFQSPYRIRTSLNKFSFLKITSYLLQQLQIALKLLNVGIYGWTAVTSLFISLNIFDRSSSAGCGAQCHRRVELLTNAQRRSTRSFHSNVRFCILNPSCAGNETEGKTWKISISFFISMTKSQDWPLDKNQ